MCLQHLRTLGARLAANPSAKALTRNTLTGASALALAVSGCVDSTLTAPKTSTQPMTAGSLPLSAQNVVIGITPPLTTQIVNAEPGDQLDPHISGDWASYTSEVSVRYYNFSTNTDAQIPMGPSARDLLSGISGSKIVFARTIVGVKTAVMVFDAANPAADPVEIDPAPGPTRLGEAIGGNTVAYVDYGLQFNGELVIHDLITSNSVRVTNDIDYDQNPSVSPDGNAVVWEHCGATAGQTNCDIWQAVKSGAGWSVSAASATSNPEGNPTTNGTVVVYDVVQLVQPGQVSLIAWRPLTGGAENRLQLDGAWAFDPSIVGNIIAFESRATGPLGLGQADIFVYDIGSNTLYQITNTPADEQLNDITVLTDGRLRLVWDSDEDGFFQRNIHAATFTLPPSAPSPAALIQQLLENVALFNLRQGISNSLDTKLDNAQAALTSAKSGDFANACAMLAAFINEVEAQSGKAITSAQAAQLLELANQARAALSCR